MLSTASTEPLVLRVAGAADAPALRDLAALDSTRLGAGPHLVAEVRDRMVAAVSLGDRRVIADPFVPTAGVVEVLLARAATATHPVRPPSLLDRLRGPHRGAHVAAPAAHALS